MYCPKCGRPVGENANFCGGCGLPKAEIIKIYEQQKEAMQTPVIPDSEEIVNKAASTEGENNSVDNNYNTDIQSNSNDFTQSDADSQADEANKSISTLLSDLDGSSPVEDYSANDLNTQSSANDTTDGLDDSASYDGYEEDEEDEEESAQEETASYTPPEYYIDYAQPSDDAHAPPYVRPLSNDSFARTTPSDSRPLDTVDFLWMLILSSLPVFGLFYIIYQAISGNNKNKRSYARAVMLFTIYAVVLGLVFFIGAVIALM